MSITGNTPLGDLIAARQEYSLDYHRWLKLAQDAATKKLGQTFYDRAVDTSYRVAYLDHLIGVETGYSEAMEQAAEEDRAQKEALHKALFEEGE